MAGNTLNTNSSLQCPHGGTVQIQSSNTKVNSESAPVAMSTDTFTISGCPFQIPAAPSPIPSPCITVQWVLPDGMNQVNSNFILSQGSVGICMSATGLPQGTVVVANTQSSATSN